MNIHPLFTHFPIALLTLYSLLEILRFKKLTEQPYYFYLKGFLLIAGSLLSIGTYITGNLAEKMTGGGDLIETHSQFATATVWFFGVLALVYLVRWIDLSKIDGTLVASRIGKAWIAAKKQASYIIHSPFLPVLAGIGFILITVTAALGGSIVYGPDVDPFVHFIYNLIIR